MRGYAYYMIGNATELAMRTGDWDWAIAELEEAVAATDQDSAARLRRAEILGLRGEDVETELQVLTDRVEKMTELQAQASVAEVRGNTSGHASRSRTCRRFPTPHTGPSWRSAATSARSSMRSSESRRPVRP